eukprot:10177201-Ditylum_brightwellii.AAC.1
MAQFNSVFSKATEKCHRMIIAHIYQDILFFPPKSTWKDAICWVQESPSLNNHQRQKIYRVFSNCEDAREKNLYYDGKQNTFVRESKRVLGSSGIEGQIIANVLQNGGNFCGTAEVVNQWRTSRDKHHVAMSTIKHHVDKFMKCQKVPTQK